MARISHGKRCSSHGNFTVAGCIPVDKVPFLQLNYRIRPNYRTVRLVFFFKTTWKLVVKYVSIYTNGTLQKKDQWRTYQMKLMRG